MAVQSDLKKTVFQFIFDIVAPLEKESVIEEKGKFNKIEFGRKLANSIKRENYLQSLKDMIEQDYLDGSLLTEDEF